MEETTLSGHQGLLAYLTISTYLRQAPLNTSRTTIFVFGHFTSSIAASQNSRLVGDMSPLWL